MLFVAILLWALGIFGFATCQVACDYETWENTPNNHRPIIIIVSLVWPLVAIYVLCCVVADIVRYWNK